MAESIKTKINKKPPKFHECSPQRCVFNKEISKDVALQCRKCHRFVHYRCSQLPAYQIQLCLSFKERRFQCPNCIKVSQHVLQELEVSRRGSTRIKDSINNLNIKINNTNNNHIDKNNDNTDINTKNDNNINNNNINNNNNNNNNNTNNNNKNEEQSNKLNSETIEDRLANLENKFKKLLKETCEMKKEVLQRPSYAKIAAIDINNINTTRDSGIALEVVDDVKEENEETETLDTSRNIIIHGVEESMNDDPKELEYEDRKYIENVIMNPMGLSSKPIQIQRIGVFTQDRASKEKYRPLKVSLESVEVKSEFLRNLTRLKGLFIKITEDLTTQERLSVKKWQDKAKKKNEHEQNKTYKWRVRGSPRSGMYLKKVFCKNMTL